jgi:archaellum component FlaF (FlaF/FlaG flagellin family)
MLCLAVVVVVCPTLHAETNQVMGELEFHGKTKVERSSGVWVDGEYVGYLKELKGSKKVLLLPGEHEVRVRQDGYQEFVQRVLVQPGKKQVIEVAMQKATAARYPTVTALVKIAVNPSRAAVFLDGEFVGHVGEFEGLGRGLLVAPGAHRIRVALPGYQTFETEINPLPKQKVEVKTDLLPEAGQQKDPMLNPKARKDEKEIPPPPEPVPQAPPPPPNL